MTADARREKIAAKYRTIIGRNYYSQAKRDYCYKKYKDGKYYSDCSSSVCYTYKECGESFGIMNTAGMYKSSKLKDVPVKIKKGQITNPDVLRVGDMLLFAGNDICRSYAGYVGHVEMVGEITKDKVILYGHGSGHPKRHEMVAYCKTRYRTKASTPLGNRGLIRVRRYIKDDPVKVEPAPEPVYETVKRDVVRVTGGSVNVRKNARTTSRILTVVHKGDLLTPRDADPVSGWNPVIWNGESAWISAAYSERATLEEQRLVNS